MLRQIEAVEAEAFGPARKCSAIDRRFCDKREDANLHRSLQTFGHIGTGPSRAFVALPNFATDPRESSDCASGDRASRAIASAENIKSRDCLFKHIS